MAASDVNDHFQLLLYERRISRYRRPTLFLAILLLGLWFPVSNNFLDWPPPSTAPGLLFSGLISLAFWAFTKLSSRLAYAQPLQDHLRVQTPFYRLKISYRRIHNIRSVDLVKLFPSSALRRGERWLLKPFYGATALAIDMHGWPLNPKVLQLFFSRFFIAVDQPSFMLLVDDWMTLSNLISVRMGPWRASRQERPRRPGISVADILRED
jgi:hypothetical protein